MHPPAFLKQIFSNHTIKAACCPQKKTGRAILRQARLFLHHFNGLIVGIGHQSNLAGTFDSEGHLTLVLGAGTGHTTG